MGVGKAPSFLRRDFLALLTGAAGWLLPFPGFGKPGDQGIGGTGVVQPGTSGKPEEDKGIGGTGVIGTIRRFGSIYVNDLKIQYPSDVAVIRDGEKARKKDLKLGQVVKVVARKNKGVWSAKTIAITSEVVGTIEQADEGRMVVAGQTVLTDALPDEAKWKEGDKVAVSGLRRPDDKIVASLIEPSDRKLTRIAGQVRNSSDSKPALGGARLEYAEPLPSQRMIVEGTYENGILQVESYSNELSAFSEPPSAFSIETYAQDDNGILRTGTGVSLSSFSGSIPPDQTVRVILTTRGTTVSGSLSSDSWQVNLPAGGNNMERRDNGPNSPLSPSHQQGSPLHGGSPSNGGTMHPHSGSPGFNPSQGGPASQQGPRGFNGPGSNEPGFGGPNGNPGAGQGGGPNGGGPNGGPGFGPGYNGPGGRR